MKDPQILVSGSRVTLQYGNQKVATADLEDLVREVVGVGTKPPSCGFFPRDVRVWLERGDATAVAIEVPPHARTVRWLAEGSSADYGRSAHYEERFIAFPYVEILVVFRRGALTGLQQLYYRRESVDAGEDLLLPNLYNVARGYGLQCWLCLVNLRSLGRFSWPDKIRAVVDHVFSAGWNRSSEVHEGNSYWSAMKSLDPRVSSLEAWEEATRRNPRFALEVPWKPAGTTLTAELGAMLDKVLSPVRLRTATDLAGLMARASRRGAHL